MRNYERVSVKYYNTVIILFTQRDYIRNRLGLFIFIDFNICNIRRCELNNKRSVLERFCPRTLWGYIIRFDSTFIITVLYGPLQFCYCKNAQILLCISQLVNSLQKV